MSVSHAHPLGYAPDGNSVMLYGTGVKGANSSDPGDPYSNFAISAHNGDSINFTTVLTSNSSSSAPTYDNQVTYSRNNADHELISRDLNTNAFTAVDNGLKFMTNSNGDVGLQGQDGWTKVGNINDRNIHAELTENGMSSAAARDFSSAARADSLTGISRLNNDFTQQDMAEFRHVEHNAIANEHAAPPGALSSAASAAPLLLSLLQTLGTSKGA